MRSERTLLGRPCLRPPDYFPGSIVFKALQGGKFSAPGGARLLGSDVRGWLELRTLARNCARGTLSKLTYNTSIICIPGRLRSDLSAHRRSHPWRRTPESRAMTANPRIDNARTIRAPHGSTLQAKSWLTEAPMRMLMNNLDPDVAEKPSELVVYGGIGRAARDWERFDQIVATLKRLEGDQTLLVQSGKPVGVFTHPCRRAARADRQFQPRAALGDLGAFQRARSQGPDDVRPDDGGVVDLHRQPGHRAGHLRDLRRTRPPALWRRSHWALDSDGGPGRHGRRAAAGGDDGRRLVPRRRMPAEPHRDAAAHRLSRPPGRDDSTRRWRSSTRRRPRASRFPSACSATPPTSFPNWCAAACGPTP